MIKRYLVLIALPVTLFTSCTKEEALPPLENISGLGGDLWTKTATDHWIMDSLTLPYNIAVKYKWDQAELPVNYTLVPPMEEKVVPVMSAIRHAWIKPYIDEAGLLFFKNISPKFFILVGSGGWNTNGTQLLGTAEGGRKVTLYDINNFRMKGMPGYNAANDSANVLQMFHTIQHEFAHILDQNISVPVSYSAGSANSYTSDWHNITADEARLEGFVRNYAQGSKDEDFADQASMMLVYGKEWFDNYVNSIPVANVSPNGITGSQARARLRQKEASIVAYFKQAWNVDFYKLQARIRTAIKSLI